MTIGLPTHSHRFLLLFLLIIVAVSYSNTLYSPLVLDDYNAFVEEPNLYLNDISLQSIAGLAQTRFGLPRVLPLATFALDHYVGKGDILQYHLTNIIIHLLCCIALFVFLQALFKTEVGRQSLLFFSPAYFSVAVCGLWALSPVQTNAVTYVVQRMASLSAFFYLGSLFCYIHGRLASQFLNRLLFFGGCMLFGLAAMLSKENSFILPLALLLVELMFISPRLADDLLRKVRWQHWLMIVLILLLVIPLMAKPWHTLTVGYADRHFTLAERLYTELRVLVFYLSLLALPLPGRMNMDHDFSVSSSLLSPPTTLVCLLFLLGLAILSFKARRRVPLLSFGIFWFFLHLLAESTVIPLELVFEHRLYLPSVGFFIALLFLIDRMLAKISSNADFKIKQVTFLAFIIILCLSSILTTIRNNDWRDAVSIYRDSYEKSPMKPRAVSNYALSLGREGKYAEAIRLEEKAIALGRKNYEEYINASNNIIMCLNNQEKYKEAIQRGEKAISEMPPVLNVLGYAKLLSNMGVSYEMEGEYTQALTYYLKALKWKPDADYIYINIATLFKEIRDDEKTCQKLGWNGKEEEIFLRLAEISLNLRQYNRAKGYLDKALEVNSSNERVENFQGIYEASVEKNRLQAELSSISNDPDYKINLAFRILMDTSDFILDYYPPLTGAPVGWLLGMAEKTVGDNLFIPVYLARWYLHNGQVDKAVQLAEHYIPKHQDFIPLLQIAGEGYLSQGQLIKAAIVFDQLLCIYPGHKNWRRYLGVISKNNNQGQVVSGHQHDVVVGSKFVSDKE